MKTVTSFLLLVLLAGCTQKTSVQLATGQLSPGWNVQILEVSEPEEVMILSDLPMGPAIPIPGKPPEKNQKWLVVRLKVTPPARPAEGPVGPPSPVTSQVPTRRAPQVVVGTQVDESPIGPLEPVASLTFSDIRLLTSSGDSYAAEGLSTSKMWEQQSAGSELREFLRPGDSQHLFKDSSERLQMSLEFGRLLLFNVEPKELDLLFAIPKGSRNLLLRL